MNVHKNHTYKDAFFADDGSILWFDDLRVSWLWQAQDDPGAETKELTVADAIEYAAEARSWVIEQTFNALIGFNVEGSLSQMKANAPADGDLALTDEEWEQALRDFARATESFQKISEQLLAAAQPRP